MKIKLLFIGLSIVFIASGCNSPEHSFSVEELKVIDSLYQRKLDSLQGRFDDMCDSIHKYDYPVMVDSLKLLREREILDIINK